MKILFLDHQGVMYTHQHPHPGQLDNFEPDNIEALNQLLTSDPEIEIVVSSDWKYWVSLSQMQTFYRSQGIIKAPIAYTPITLKYSLRNYSKQRSTEINLWIHRYQPFQWVAIDDLDLRSDVSNFVYVDQPLQGLKLYINQVLSYLQKI